MAKRPTPKQNNEAIKKAIKTVSKTKKPAVVAEAKVADKPVSHHAAHHVDTNSTAETHTQHHTHAGTDHVHHEATNTVEEAKALEPTAEATNVEQPASEPEVKVPEPEVVAVAEPEAAVEPEVEQPVGPSIFMQYMQQNFAYTGDNEAEAWQLFCINFSGALRFINMSPSTELFTPEQIALIKNAIA